MRQAFSLVLTPMHLKKVIVDLETFMESFISGLPIRVGPETLQINLKL